MIHCFSGTGNSALVARLLREALGKEDKDDMLGLVFPVHAWGMPLAMESFLAPLFSGRKWNYVYLVMTCGTEAGYCERTFPYPFDAAYSIIMPNTYVGLPFFNTDGRKLEERKLQAAQERVADIARRITERRKEIDVKRGIWPWLMTYKIRPFFNKHLARPRHIHLETERCNGCGKCVAACPLENISTQHGIARHASNCCLCLGCYHNCPQKALWVGPCGKNKDQKVLARK